MQRKYDNLKGSLVLGPPGERECGRACVGGGAWAGRRAGGCVAWGGGGGDRGVRCVHAC